MYSVLELNFQNKDVYWLMILKKISVFAIQKYFMEDKYPIKTMFNKLGKCHTIFIFDFIDPYFF